ncbi:MAG: DUF1385 domain-containing protein [Myxococcales bacterium]|nr:DUF1385 domain-containing protein [Polyangiaceae bacterium]MDW8247820.1 DUF1385 domain-containing protein [Myxococcales bacterium]
MNSSQASSSNEAPRPYIGGQALLEGVMMRSPHSFAIVCRRRSGELSVRERPIADERKGVRAFPFVRGVATLVESLRLGSEALQYSSKIFEEDLAEEEAAEARARNRSAGLSTLLLTLRAQVEQQVVALSLPIVALVTRADGERGAGGEKQTGGAGQALIILFALGIFVAAPQAGANLINRVFHLGLDLRSASFQLITGVMKLAIVIGYLSLLRNIPEIRRVFQYHGAEHKTISTYEAQEPLTVANARGKTTLHPRCGTTFLVMVAMVSVVIFSAIGPFLPRIGPQGGLAENLILFLMKLPFIPVLAAVTFELQRIFARYCTKGPLRVLLWPGFLVQKITTIEPDDDQLEVALASLRTTLWREDALASAPTQVTELRFPSYNDLVTYTGYTPSQG